MITWIDKRSILLDRGKRYRAGDVIPAGVLAPDRITQLVTDKKIRVNAPRASQPEPVVVEPEIQEPVKAKAKRVSKEKLDEVKIDEHSPEE